MTFRVAIVMPGTWAARKGRVWQILALALMFGAAYCTISWLQAVGKIRSLSGLFQYTAQVQKLQALTVLWLGLSLILPFLAATLLGRSAQSVHRYLGRLLISVLGTVAFTICLLLVGYHLRKP